MYCSSNVRATLGLSRDKYQPLLNSIRYKQCYYSSSKFNKLKAYSLKQSNNVFHIDPLINTYYNTKYNSEVFDKVLHLYTLIKIRNVFLEELM